MSEIESKSQVPERLLQKVRKGSFPVEEKSERKRVLKARLTDALFNEAQERMKKGVPKIKICEELNISRYSLNTRLKKLRLADPAHNEVPTQQ